MPLRRGFTHSTLHRHAPVLWAPLRSKYEQISSVSLDGTAGILKGATFVVHGRGRGPNRFSCNASQGSSRKTDHRPVKPRLGEPHTCGLQFDLRLDGVSSRMLPLQAWPGCCQHQAVSKRLTYLDETCHGGSVVSSAWLLPPTTCTTAYLPATHCGQ